MTIKAITMMSALIYKQSTVCVHHKHYTQYTVVLTTDAERELLAVTVYVVGSR